MPACPICSTASNRQRDGTPYWMCPGCGVWWQDPMPPKLWHGAHETDPVAMSEPDKRANEYVARWLFDTVLGGNPGRTLDVGASYPWLAQSLHRLGCFAMALDGSEELERSGLDIDAMIVGDFEKVEPRAHGERFDLLTFIHSFEHLYGPAAALRKARALLADDGALFIRMPDNQVEGIERDLTPGHYTIHPFVHALSSIAELCAQTHTFRIGMTYELKPGQRDMVLLPL